MDNADKERRKARENNFIIRKSLVRGQSRKTAEDNIKLKDNLRNLVKGCLRQEGNDEQKSMG